MPCYHPKKGYLTESGLVLHNMPYGHSGAWQPVPCGRCIGCRMDYRNDRATRMMHEAEYHENSLFVTLTYEDSKLPDDFSLNKEDYQLFLKRLRKWSKNKIRYVLSGEYGSQTLRPHYHAIIYGLELPDMEQHATNNRGEPLYQSAILESIWRKGHTSSGAVTKESCGYVAGYMLKDSNGDYVSKQYETVHPETGEIVQRKRPFVSYSNRPGIGYQWYHDFKDDCFPSDFIVQDGHKVPVPEYYLRLYEKENPVAAEKIKAKRLEKAIGDAQTRWNNSSERLEVREVVKNAQVATGRKGSVVDPV